VVVDARPRALVVDDDTIVRRSIRRVLEADCIVDEAATIAEARAFMQKHAYLCWIIDVNLGHEGTGLGLLAWARGEQWSTRALVLTGQDDRTLPNQALIWDAFFAFKPLGATEIRRFLAQARAQPRGVPELGRRYARLTELSPRETDLVVAAASGIPRDEIARFLGLGEDTIKTLIRRIRVKTGVGNLQELLSGLLQQASGLAAPWSDVTESGEADRSTSEPPTGRRDVDIG
jgi:DNA-binding NarL/FixJ family response regulator